MNDFSKISNAVRAAIEKLGGENKKIDTRAELLELGNWLNGNRDKMGAAEIEYVEGLMVERSHDIATKEFKENGTKAAAKEIAKILKAPGPDKKTLDSPVEAQNLLTLLKNPPADFNKADLDYIMYLLQSNGYGYLLQEVYSGGSVPTQTPDAVTQDTEVTNSNLDTTTPTSEKKSAKCPPPEPSEPTTTVEEPQPDIPAERSVPVDKPAQQSTITEAGRAEGAALASQLLSEFNEIITDNDDVKEILAKVNPENAYNFLIGINKGLNTGINTGVLKNISDFFNKLSYKDTLNVMQSLEQQAINMGLGDNDAVKALAQENKRIAAIVAQNPKEDPSLANAQYSDAIIQAVLDEMAKTIDGKAPQENSPTPVEKETSVVNTAITGLIGGIGGIGIGQIVGRILQKD